MNDLNIMPTELGTTDLNFENSGGSVVTGVNLVAQMFVTFLLAQLGSVLHNPDYGTDFVYNAVIGTISNEADLQLQFTEAVVALREFQNAALGDEDEVENTVDESELFEDAQLETFEYVDDATVMLTVTVTNQVGDTAQIKLPLIKVEL